MKRSSILGCAILVIASACGGARPIPSEDAEDADGASARRDRRDRRRTAEPDEEELPLDPAALVEGTGVRLRAPRGSQRSAIGSTFIHTRRRIQIVIAAAEGDLSVHQHFRQGLLADAEEIESEEIELDGAPATVTVDRMTQNETELERVWAIAREGTRSVAVMGVYQAERSERLRPLVRASVLSLRFDREATIDPEEALGWRIDPIEGLELVRTASTTVSYSVDGSPPEGDGGRPMLYLVPVPIEVPEAQRSSLCPQILEQIVHLPEDAAVDRQAIDAGEVQGCDVAGQAGESGSTATYAALVFRGPAAFMIGGSVAVADREAWIARFRGAARTLRAVRPLPTPSRSIEDEEEEEEDEDEEEEEIESEEEEEEDDDD